MCMGVRLQRETTRLAIWSELQQSEVTPSWYNFRYKTCRWSVLETLVVRRVVAGVVDGVLNVWWVDGRVMEE